MVRNFRLFEESDDYQVTASVIMKFTNTRHKMAAIHVR